MAEKTRIGKPLQDVYSKSMKKEKKSIKGWRSIAFVYCTFTSFYPRIHTNSIMANTACWPGALVCQIFFSWSTSPVKGIGRRMAEKEGLESLYKMFTMFLYLECTCPRVEAWHRKDGSHPIHARPRLHSAPFFSLDDDALAAHSLPSDGAAAWSGARCRACAPRRK